jgi:hypothetical protein
MSQATLDRAEWIDATVAARLLGVGLRALSNGAPQMGVRVRFFPGRTGPRYNRPDVETALARLEAEEQERVARAKAETRQPYRHPRLGRKRETARTATQ